jgi:predicted nucleotide-binding protein
VVLVVSRAEAEAKLQIRIQKGRELHTLRINNEGELTRARNEYRKWSDYNLELLLRMFSEGSLATEYQGGPAFGIWNGPVPLYEQIEEFRRGVDIKVQRLESIFERLELIPVLEESRSTASKLGQSELAARVFIVHGHDDRIREAVARFIERLGLDAVILHEQPNAGRTIIEKFESCADVGFAVVLLTPDDVGASRAASADSKLRARQNVIFELGFFFGKLGRNRVAALYSDGVELPSDLHGILYIALDPHGGWHLQLAKEMKQAGLPIDLNRVI